MMKRKAKELQQAKREGRKGGRGIGGGGYGGGSFSPLDYKTSGGFSGMEPSEPSFSKTSYQPR